MEHSQKEYLAMTNDLLPEEEKIPDEAYFSKLLNLKLGLSTPRKEAILEIMEKEAKNLWDFEPELKASRLENDSLKVEIYNLTSYKRQYSRTAMPAFFTFLFIISLFCFWVTAHEVWRPSIELAVTKKHRNEKLEGDIKILLEIIDSKKRSIAGCDETVRKERNEYDLLNKACKEEIARLNLIINTSYEKMMMGD